MVNDSEISYGETEIRRLLSDLAAKKQTGKPEEVAELERKLALKKRDLEDLKHRKRRDEDRTQREMEQKKRDDRRKRLA